MDRIEPREIERILPKYMKWEAEGQPPYMYSYDEKKPQYYYDWYHHQITKKENGLYEFCFQTDGAPEGDTWVSGVFRIINNKVQIIEQYSYFT